ncbi:MAG: TIGR04283 family arsenosugar biosynthesis glycosyltransferase [Rubrivivax sp.]|nr:TIGR04283 family arsenosugar biosynthesis glycosyltransferase [Rubrivivax sp.]
MSVVVPVLNEALGVRQCLQALAPLRAAGAEIIVVDGGSHDGTAALCERRADRVLQGPRGRARQMNAGAARARGDVLLFLHADTRLPDAALTQVVDALGPGGRAWGRFDVQIEGRSRWLPVVAALMNLRSRLTGIATGDQAIFMHRSAFAAVGGFPEQPLMEDVEMSRRLKRIGAPACLRARVVTSGRRWDQRGALATIVLMWRLRLLYWLGASPERLARAYR